MRLRLTIVFTALLITLALPLGLRRGGPHKEAPPEDTLVLITPHNETIRREFDKAFRQHMLAEHGRKIVLDWRVPGGTSEIRKFIDAEFVHSRKNERIGIGIDLFFGGGVYDFEQQQKAGQLEATEVFSRHPEWFQDDIIPASFSGEVYYHEGGEWVGTCLSSFGIIYNRDALARLGFEGVPDEWEDLAHPAFVGKVGLVDPTKSGSSTKAFEMLIQEQLQNAIASIPPEKAYRPNAIEDAKTLGWTKAMQLIQRISGNARYFTNESAKIPLDVAQGNAAVGMSIDFYGRTLAEAVADPATGQSRVGFVTPRGGSSYSVDPIAILKGAPNKALAEDFIDFVLSLEGQKLWDFKVGAPGGPEERSLRRLPLRRDLYTEEYLPYFADPEALPYDVEEPFVYLPELTGSRFSSIQFIVRVMCLDPHPEQKTAWKAILKAHQENGQLPRQAYGVFSNVDLVNYGNSGDGIRRVLRSDNQLETVILAKQLAGSFRKNYQRAYALAKAALP
ncbi:MAG: extracellular solute-binding protein [Verrucomicrobiota bacterium]